MMEHRRRRRLEFAAIPGELGAHPWEHQANPGRPTSSRHSTGTNRLEEGKRANDRARERVPSERKVQDAALLSSSPPLLSLLAMSTASEVSSHPPLSVYCISSPLPNPSLNPRLPLVLLTAYSHRIPYSTGLYCVLAPSDIRYQGNGFHVLD